MSSPTSSSSSVLPFPCRSSAASKDGESSGSTSDLLRRVQDFLPQIQAANASVDTVSGRIDDGIVPESKEDFEGDGEQDFSGEKPPAKKQRTDLEQQEITTAPAIQLDLTLGVDVNHPAMSLLERNDGDNSNEDDKDDETDRDPGKICPKAEQAVKNLLATPNPAPRLAKGPLIELL